MNPSFKLMVNMLRSGASADDALDEYCQTRCVVPIGADDVLIKGVPPENASAGFSAAFSVWTAVETLQKAIKDGTPDADLEKVFHDACKPRVLWRGMRKGERWTPRQLYDRMPANDQTALLNLVGVEAVAKIILSDA